MQKPKQNDSVVIEAVEQDMTKPAQPERADAGAQLVPRTANFRKSGKKLHNQLNFVEQPVCRFGATLGQIGVRSRQVLEKARPSENPKE